MTRSLAPPILLALAGIAASIVILATDGPMRVIMALALILFIPGAALVHLLDIALDVLTSVTLAIAFSASIAIVVSLGLFYAGVWSLEAAVLALTLLVVGMSVADLLVRAAHRRPAAGVPPRSHRAP